MAYFSRPGNMFASTSTTSSEHSVGSPFSMPTTLGSPFGMSNSSGTTSGLFRETSSTFPSPTTFRAPSFPAAGGSTTAFGGSTTSFESFSLAPTRGFSSSGIGGTSVFGQAPAFGASSTTEVGVNSTPTLGPSTMSFGHCTDLDGNVTTKSLFGNQNSLPGSLVFNGQPLFGILKEGSRIATYTATVESDTHGIQGPQLVSVSAMPVYKDKSHEELRCEDYHFGDKGEIASHNLMTKSNTFSSSSASVTPFLTPTSNMLGFPDLTSSISNPPFSLSLSFSNFLTHLPSPTSVTPPDPASGPNNIPSFSHPCSSQAFPTPFSVSFNIHAPGNPFSSIAAYSSPAFASYPVSGSFSSSASENPFLTITLSTSPAFQSTPFISYSNSRSVNPFSSTITPSTASRFSAFSSLPFTSSSCTPSTSVGDFTFSPFRYPISFSPALPVYAASSVTPSVHFPSQATSCILPSHAGFSNFFNSTATGGSSCFANSTAITSTLAPSATFMMSTRSSSFSSTPTSTPSPAIKPSLSFTNTQTPPSFSFFPSHSPHPSIGGISTAGGQNAMPQGSRSQTSAVGQSSSAVNPFLPKIPKMAIDVPGSSPTDRYGISSLPVSFLSDDKEKKNSLFVPRENPRDFVYQPTEQWPLWADSEILPALEQKFSTIYLNENGKNSIGNVSIFSDKPNLKPAYGTTKVRDSQVEVIEDVEALLPKLQLFGYYTEPRIQELAAKERDEPGFCSRVKNFLVGRHGYGSIMFMGETDVRKLDLGSYVQFNYHEIIVYMDQSKKHAVGQGLNKPAEVTLLNIKCTDKETGNQWVDGPKVDKYRGLLMKTTAELGAEFVSYDPVGGEWKFRVQHF